jgi:hypothetical protein
LDVLYRLKEYYSLFGGKVRSLVIDLHLKPNVPELAQRELLLAIIQKPSSEQFKAIQGKGKGKRVTQPVATELAFISRFTVRNLLV